MQQILAEGQAFKAEINLSLFTNLIMGYQHPLSCILVCSINLFYSTHINSNNSNYTVNAQNITGCSIQIIQAERLAEMVTNI